MTALMQSRTTAALVRLSVLCLMGGMAAGCAGTDQRMAMAFTDPSAYRLSTCQELAAAQIGTVQRKNELEQLISRAEQGGVAGSVVSTATYRPEYLSAVGRLRVIGEVARNKDCTNPPFGPSAPAPVGKDQRK